jgi:LysM repeat protein
MNGVVEKIGAESRGGDSARNKISKKYGVSINDLAKMNKLSNPNKLKIGQVLKVNPEASFSENPWKRIGYTNSDKDDGIETEEDDISDVGSGFVTGLQHENTIIIGGDALKSVQQWKEVKKLAAEAVQEITADGKWSAGDVAIRSFKAGSLPSNIKNGLWEGLVAYVKGEDPWKDNSQNSPIHVIGSFTLSVRVNANGTTATVCVYDRKSLKSLSDNRADASSNRSRKQVMIIPSMTNTYQRYLWNMDLK